MTLDKDPIHDDEPIPEQILFSTHATIDGTKFTHSETFELFCNESTGCDVAGRVKNSSGGFDVYSSGESVADGFGLVESNYGYDYGSSAVREISCVGTGGIPVPQTWSLMIIGFGAIGTRVRRRSRAVSAAGMAL